MIAYELLNTLLFIIFLVFIAVAPGWLIFHSGDFITKMKRRRHRCQNCHFLIKESPQLPLTSWNERERDDVFPRINIPPNELEHDKWGRYKGYDMTVGCHKKLWSLEHNELTDVEPSYRTRELKEKVTLNRGESCFFIPYYEGMPMETAEQLFADKSENRRSNRRILWAQLGSVLAFLTSLLSIYLQFRD